MIVSGMPERNGDRHVSEIASMALDLLAGIIDTPCVNLIWSTNIGPDSRLSGFPDPPPTQCKADNKVGKSASSFLWRSFSCSHITFSQDGLPQWPCHGGGGRQQHPQLLHHVRHRQLGQVGILFFTFLSSDGFDLQGDGKDGRGHEDPYQLYLKGASRHGCVQTNSPKYILYICYKIYPPHT